MKKEFLWWRDGVIYQIYPRSFADSDDDGIGDLRGITDHMDYLVDLGIDAIWLSPINPSPDVDFGYDVSDYQGIDPKFGTMRDFNRLVNAAERAGIRIVMDLVLNHTSDQHPWFQSARSSKNDPFRDWYIWREVERNGKLPNNWQSVFGGSGWEWDADTDQYYYHMFYKQQPDLNWRNPKVRRELLDVFRFWLDKGVKGFRLDVFNMYFEDVHFRSNPVKMIGRRPFERQTHTYDCDRPELFGVLADIRQVLDKYDETYVIGETFLGTPEKAASYCGSDFLHACFDFQFLESKRSPTAVLKTVKKWESALGVTNWPNYVLNNHDTPRCASRFGLGENDERLKVVAAMLLTLRGTPFLYYGEEIGMRDICLKRGEILDPIGKKYWPIYKGRDGCRAPMQWNTDTNAGFSPVKPWLPVHPDFHQRNVETQSRDNQSLLQFYKQLISFRRAQPELISGDFQSLDVNSPHVLAYTRVHADQAILVLLNFAGKQKEITLPDEGTYLIGLSSTGREPGKVGGSSLDLCANEVLILIKD